MDREKNREFITKTETLVKPLDVTAISFLGDFNKILPLKSQQKLMKKGSEKIPYMGFIVDPYCFFLSYEITDNKAAQELLPPDYELLETSLFENGKKAPSVIISFFNARTSAFIGTRMEIYLIAKRKSDGKAAWIIIDYVTNTNSYDPAHGFSGYNSDPTLFTTTPYGEMLADIKNSNNSKRLTMKADITKGKMKKLDYTLWVEGNLAVDYGGSLQDSSSTVFSLIFDPALMNEALNIPLQHLSISENSFLSTIINPESPTSAACFPFSQHYIIKQDVLPGEIRDEQDLEKKITEFTSSKNFKTMKGSDIKRPILFGMIISAVINYGLIIFLLIKLLN